MQADMAVAEQELQIYSKKKKLDLSYFGQEKEIELSYELRKIKAQTDGKDENIITQGIVDEKVAKSEQLTSADQA